MSFKSIIKRLITSKLKPRLEFKELPWRSKLIWLLIMLAVTLSAIWLLLVLWYQFGVFVMTGELTLLLTALAFLSAALIITLTTLIIAAIVKPNELNAKFKANVDVKKLLTNYAVIWLIGFGGFVSIQPLQDRDWKPEVAKILSYSRDANNPNLVTLYNVRNFDWINSEDATERWESRTIDLDKLSGVDVINSYWMGPLIAHTLVSFHIEGERPIAMSFEIRKENGESFSALGGFFKRYELSLIASEERDIIYTRTNARGEQVYLFPISHLNQSQVKALFEAYLTASDELNAEPDWYNTLTSNCTNIIFYMARIISGDRLPWDYRIWVSGWLPNYLYKLGLLDSQPNTNLDAKNAQNQSWSMDEWYERAHINPKVRDFSRDLNNKNIHGDKFSQKIREGLPQPRLIDSKTAKANYN
ncbi:MULTISPECIES: DUF4105 domain-containing protein [Psychrobacter]|uniref:Lnb N-terminal periplasmic domain-containing protein n=1 Tax=Psychrobacter TaxID=497 RepID=UPI00146EBF49|nr:MULTISPECIES: DUF4105 domain-containing protein [Psychrobacter]